MAPRQHCIQPYCVIGDKNVLLFFPSLFALFLIFHQTLEAHIFQSLLPSLKLPHQIVIKDDWRRTMPMFIEHRDLILLWADSLFLFLFVFSSDNGVSGLSHAIHTLYISSTGTSFYMHACIVIYTLCKIAGFFFFLCHPLQQKTFTENLWPSSYCSEHIICLVI